MDRSKRTIKSTTYSWAHIHNIAHAKQYYSVSVNTTIQCLLCIVYKQNELKKNMVSFDLRHSTCLYCLIFSFVVSNGNNFALRYAKAPKIIHKSNCYWLVNENDRKVDTSQSRKMTQFAAYFEKFNRKLKRVGFDLSLCFCFWFYFHSKWKLSFVQF